MIAVRNIDKECAVDDCNNKRKGREWCDKHYSKWRKYGDPLAGYERKRRNGEGWFSYGYVLIQKNGIVKRQHVINAENALGKPLPEGAEVHHVNSVRHDNRNENLVICPDYAYHALLHTRTEALEKCGNPDWRKCRICGQHDDTSNMRFYFYAKNNARTYTHRACDAKYFREARAPRIKKARLLKKAQLASTLPPAPEGS